MTLSSNLLEHASARLSGKRSLIPSFALSSSHNNAGLSLQSRIVSSFDSTIPFTPALAHQPVPDKGLLYHPMFAIQSFETKENEDCTIDLPIAKSCAKCVMMNRKGCLEPKNCTRGWPSQLKLRQTRLHGVAWGSNPT